MKRDASAQHGFLSMALVSGLGLLGPSSVLAQNPQWLPVSEGVYRLPYADNTTVGFSNDHTNHPASLNRIDLTGQGGGPYTVVAAGAGWIRLITENNDTTCPDDPNQNPNNDFDNNGTTTAQENQQAQQAACGGYGGPSSFCCERDVEANGGACPGAGTCLNVPNNFVWMEHPNGEWTKYTHMQRGSVGTGTDNNGNPGAGRVVNQFVNAGAPLGIEGDVGIAGGPHVHFEVAVPEHVELPPTNNATAADPDGPPDTVNNWFNGGFLVNDVTQDDVLFEDPDGDGVNNPDDDLNRQNRISVFCQLGFAFNNSDADPSIAGPCDDQCGTDTSQLSGTITAGNIFYRQVTDSMGNPASNFIVRANSGVAIRAGDRITLSPGFQAETSAYFSASIGACDSPGGS